MTTSYCQHMLTNQISGTWHVASCLLVWIVDWLMSAMFIELCTTCQVDIVLHSAVQHASAIEVAVQHGCAHLSLHLSFEHCCRHGSFMYESLMLIACEMHSNA